MRLLGPLLDQTYKSITIAGLKACSSSLHNEKLYEAWNMFRDLNSRGIPVDLYTYASLIQTFANTKALTGGKQIHAHVLKIGIDQTTIVGTKLLILYTKCDSLALARQVFDKIPKRNALSWTVMIGGVARHGQWEEALSLFYQMQAAGYSQAGHGDDALKLFSQMQLSGMMPDAISWTAMIAGYAQNSQGDEALKLFCQMQLAGFKPNSVTVASVLPACANLAAVQHGRELHDFIVRHGFESDVFVGSALIDMYSKCGSLGDAGRVFSKMHQRNIVSWNSMIAGYALHGQGENALELFHRMQQEGMTPDHITFTGVLSACSHAGLVDEGWTYFEHMRRDYRITPSVEHCACVVDLLGRAGHLDEACGFINNMAVEPNACVWGALLGACRIHHNIELGEHVARQLFELEPENSGNYVLLSNIFAEAGRWDEVAKVRKIMKDRGVKKRAGCSWIEVKNKVHAFLVGDKSHPQTEKIYAVLQSLAGEIKEAGYMPHMNFVLHNVEEEEKEHILCGHSEKLAIAFGLINTCHGTPIRVIKNLRVCGDCHTSTKLISKIVGREIFVRDGSRFHHFKDGLCSCGDYW